MNITPKNFELLIAELVKSDMLQLYYSWRVDIAPDEPTKPECQGKMNDSFIAACGKAEKYLPAEYQQLYTQKFILDHIGEMEKYF